METLLQRRLLVPKDVLIREVEGESVILNLNTEHYFGLDEVGTRMLAVLSESESIQDAYQILQSEYDVDPGALRRDLEELIQKLVEHGLVEVVER